MPSSFTSNVAFEKPADGEQTGSWGGTVNDNMDIVDRLTSQVGSIALTSSTYTLTTSTSGALSEGHYSAIKFTGTPGATCTVTINPNTIQRIYTIYNNTNQTVIMAQGSGSTVSIPAGEVSQIYSDGAGAGAAVTPFTDKLKDVLYSGDIGSTVQGYDADLAAIGALAKTDGNFIVGNGSTWVVESGNTVLQSIGVTATTTELNVLDGITASTAELNILDGVTATASELNVLDGITASTAQLNVLNGITASTTELNYTDGVTSNIQTQLNSKASTSTSISTGSGLTGGGNLTTSRTLSVSFSSNQAEVKTALNASGSAPIYACRAWVNFAGNGSIRASGNVSSISVNGTGNYTVNFSTSMPDANYAAVCKAARNGTNYDFDASIPASGSGYNAGSFQVLTGTQSVVQQEYSPLVTVAIFR